MWNFGDRRSRSAAHVDLPSSSRTPGRPEWRFAPSFAAVGASRLILILLIALAVAGLQYWYIFAGETAQPLSEPELTLALLRAELGFYGLLVLLLWLTCYRAGVGRGFTLGERPSAGEVRGYLLLGVPKVAVGIAGLYLIFSPLSVLYPEFVSSWILDAEPILLLEPQAKAILADLLTALVIVLVAPVIEEVFFRGFLLNALWRRYGFKPAVVISALIISVAHVDVLGAFVFAAVLSVVFACTRSLIGPILVHVSNNAIVVLEALVEGLVFGEVPPSSSLEASRNFWWLAPVGAAIGLPWLWLYLRRLPGFRAAPARRNRGPSDL